MALPNPPISKSPVQIEITPEIRSWSGKTLEIFDGETRLHVLVSVITNSPKDGHIRLATFGEDDKWRGYLTPEHIPNIRMKKGKGSPTDLVHGALQGGSDPSALVR